MTNYPLLEICVETLEAALAAELGGADRIELCRELSVGGITPSAELMREVRANVDVPVFAMIRPRCGDFCYTTEEFEQMVRDIATAKDCGMNGAVLGILHADRRVDIARTQALVELALPLPVTFHRAFDETPDLREALGSAIATGAARVLTSGGKPSAELGAAEIAGLVEAGGEKITVLCGGGINSSNLERVAQLTRAREFHTGLSSVLPYPQSNHEAFEEEVRKLADLLRKPALAGNLASKTA
jgi:copper homeostasis protein